MKKKKKSRSDRKKGTRLANSLASLKACSSFANEINGKNVIRNFCDEKGITKDQIEIREI